MSDITALTHSIGEKVRLCRLARHLTQSDLAHGRFTKSYISQLERGRVTPSLKALDHLARRLGVPVGWLLDPHATRASTLLCTATTCFFLGEHRRAWTLLSQVADRRYTLTTHEHCLRALLLIRLHAASGGWASVLAGCAALHRLLRCRSHQDLHVLVPHAYYWGRAYRVYHDDRRALHHWRMALTHVDASGTLVLPEAFHLIRELSVIYAELGDQTNFREHAILIKALANQVTSVGDFSRWILARHLEHTHVAAAAGCTEVERHAELDAAQTWACAELALKTLEELRTRL